MPYPYLSGKFKGMEAERIDIVISSANNPSIFCKVLLELVTSGIVSLFKNLMLSPTRIHPKIWDV